MAAVANRLALALLAVAALPIAALAQTIPATRAALDSEVRTAAPAVAVRANPSVPNVDGRLDDPAWALAPVMTDFIQRDPAEGQPATERTEVRVVFADDALYVAVRAFDSRPDAIAGHLTRRDQDSPSDWIAVGIDSYHDRRTAFGFFVNPAGVKRDIYYFNDVDSDDSWDAVWDVATSRDGEGWSAEFRIPFSQLRFSSTGSQVFGFQVMRRINRINEESHWRLMPRNANAMVSLWGDLNGLHGIRPPRRLEVLPYTLARGENNVEEPGNPYQPNTAASATAGADLKIGLGSNLTVDATINPDFGQVDADPAIVNLSAFETFYPERRPFFTEGVNIFRFPISLGDGGGANEQLFYSRRIGRRPQGEADPRGGYAETIDFTRILGAAKLSGKTANGWTVGLLGALTREMEAESRDSLGVVHVDPVEPRSSYLVGRLARDWRGGRTVLGLFGTVVNRQLPADLDWLRSSAYTLGLDLNHRFGPRDGWRVRGWVVGSRVNGSAEAIRLTQESPARYYQRPDHDYVSFDTTRTSLSGLAAQTTIGKENGFFRFMTGFDTRTPGYEVNDAGYMRDADRTIQFAWVGLRWNRPGPLGRRGWLNFNQNTAFNWGWDRLGAGGNVNGGIIFHNYWEFSAGINYNLGGYSTELRGGPLFIRPANGSGWFWVGSDDRKRLRASLNGYAWRQPDSDSRGGGVSPEIQWRPTSWSDFSLGPSMDWNNDSWQYLQTSALTGGTEYFFGVLEQTTVSLGLRANLTFTPTLSLQVYAAPFYSAGQYHGVQRVLDPRGATWADRMQRLDDQQASRDANGNFVVDFDRDGTAEEVIANPDFSYTSLRSNVVLRWEYRRGSTLFFVWQQNRGASSSNGEYRFGDAARAIGATEPQNIFMVKMNYWFSL